MINLKMLLSLAILTPMDDPRLATNRWGAPFLLMGPPGTAKTSFIAQVASRMELMDETMYLTAHPPEDFSGIPVMRDDKGKLVNFVPQISRLVDVGSGVLNLDELTTAREASQNAAMNLVLERTIAGEKISPRIRIAAAANPPEQAAGARDLAPPAANRFLHFEAQPLTIEQWTEFELRKSLPPGTPMPVYADEKDIVTAEEGEKIVKANWVHAHRKQILLAKAFHTANVGALHLLPNVGAPERGHAWASARSWSMGVAAMATASAMAHEECAPDLLMAAVGLNAATAYTTWLASFDLPQPEAVLDGTWVPDKLRIDVAATAYSSAMLHVLNTKDSTQRHVRANGLWSALAIGAMKHGLMDIVKPTASDLVRRKLVRDPATNKIHKQAEVLLNELGTRGHADFMEPG